MRNYAKPKEISENREEFVKMVKELRESCVIVEGKKDKRALQLLGVEDVRPINGTALTSVAEELSVMGIKEVVILTDFDREGKALYLKLKRLLQRYRIKTNTRLRKMIMGLGRCCIEDFRVADSLLFELPLKKDGTFKSGGSAGEQMPLKNLRGDSYGKISSYFRKVRDKGQDKGQRNSGKARCHRRGFRPDRGSAGF
jgi:5S rRNA maturation endonuclease (ribonuclease M5)